MKAIVETGLSRRRFLESAMLLSLGVGVDQLKLTKLLHAALPVPLQENGALKLEVSGAVRDVHDPAIIQADDAYYIFSTGDGIPILQIDRSAHLVTPVSAVGLWRNARLGARDDSRRGEYLGA